MLAHWGVINTFVTFCHYFLLRFIELHKVVPHSWGACHHCGNTFTDHRFSSLPTKCSAVFFCPLLFCCLTNGTWLFNLTALSVNAWKACSFRQNRSKWHVSVLYETFYMSVSLQVWKAERGVYEEHTHTEGRSRQGPAGPQVPHGGEDIQQCQVSQQPCRS